MLHSVIKVKNQIEKHPVTSSNLKVNQVYVLKQPSTLLQIRHD